MVERGCRVGVAFDGDGDRAILVDANGRIVDGDAVLLMCGRHLKQLGQLEGNGLVATVMSNIGLEIALRESGIDMVRCPVGDKYVMEEMIKRGLSLGGEQSGHIIFSTHLFTGDGIVTALSVLRVMADTGRELADLAAELVTYPQVLLNVRVREKRDLQTVPAVADAMKQRRGSPGRQRPPAGALLGHRAAAARDDRGQGPAGDPGLGDADREHGQGASGMTGGRSRAKLSVNVNKVATLRNSRGGCRPERRRGDPGLPRRRRARDHRASAG